MAAVAAHTHVLDSIRFGGRPLPGHGVLDLATCPTPARSPDREPGSPRDDPAARVAIANSDTDRYDRSLADDDARAIHLADPRSDINIATGFANTLANSAAAPDTAAVGDVYTAANPDPDTATGV
jgi:hypothetical protein